MTSEEWAPSEEPKGERGGDERSPVVNQAQHEDTGPRYLEVMKGKMGDNGRIIYDYINKESDGGPDEWRVSGAHEPIIPKDNIIYGGIKYGVINKECDVGPRGWRVSGAHEPVIPKGNKILMMGDYEIEIERERSRSHERDRDRERDRDLLHSIEIDREETDRDQEKVTFIEHRWQLAAAA